MMANQLPFVPVGRLTIQRGLPRKLIEIGQGLKAVDSGEVRAFTDENGKPLLLGQVRSAYERDLAAEQLVAPQAATDKSSAYVFQMANAQDAGGFTFEATFEASHKTADQGQANLLTGTLYGIGREHVDRIPSGAAVLLEAGYAGGYPCSIRSIFYGTLNYAVPRRQDGALTWEFTATMAPTSLLDAYVPVSVKFDQGQTFEAVCRMLMEPLGVKLSLPEAFSQQYVGNFTARAGAYTEFKGLVARLGQRLGSADRFVETTSTENFLEIHVVDTEQTSTLEILEIDLDSPVVTNVAPQRGSLPTPPAGVPPRTPEDVVDIYRNTTVEAMEVSMILDPRLHLGMLVQWPPADKDERDSDFGSGSFIIDAIQHDLADWSTTITGKLVTGSFLKPSQGESTAEDS